MYPICIPACLHQLWRHMKGTWGAGWSEELVLLSPMALRCNMIQKQVFLLLPQQHQGCSHPALNREWVACAVNKCGVQSILPYYPYQWEAELVIRVLFKIFYLLGAESLHSQSDTHFFQAHLKPFTCSGLCYSNLIIEYGFRHLKGNYIFCVFNMALL